MKGMDSFFNAIGYFLAVALPLVIALGLTMLAWSVMALYDFVAEGFRLGAQLRDMRLTTPSSAEIKRWVIERRQRQDEERIVRLKRRQAEATARLKPDLADEDVSQEQFEAGAPKYLLSKNPAIGGDGKTLYFKEVLAGRAVGEGSAGLRDAKPIWTPLRQYARRFILGEAQSWARRLPDNKSIFIVCDETGATSKQIEVDGIVHRVMDRLTQEGVTLEEMNAALAQRSEERSGV